MNINPDTMNEYLKQNPNDRYQRKDASQSVEEDFADEELTMDGGFGVPKWDAPSPASELDNMPKHTPFTAPQREYREYQNPVHTQEEEILPGLYQSDIDSWKKQFGDIWVAEIKDQTFIYRALERYEYKAIIAVPNTDPLMREEMICEHCVLYPTDYVFSTMANGKAGYPAVLAELVMEHSGFTRDVQVRKL